MSTRGYFIIRKIDKMKNKFWDIIEELDWKGACKETERPYIITRERFENIIAKFDSTFGSEIENTAKAYRQILLVKLREYSFEKYDDRYVFPRVSDDSLWDLTAHIVGLGEKVYNNIMEHPEQIVDYLNEYQENFEYTFNIK